jgi:hypothetical protein
MTPWARCALFVVLNLGTSQVFAQNPNLRSDPQATAILQQAIAQLGGQAAWGKVADIAILGSCASQGSTEKSADSSQIHWVQAGKEFRYDATDSGQTATFVSGHGHPARTEGQNAVAWSRAASEAQEPYFAPALMLFRELNSERYVLEFLGSTTLSSSTQSVIHVRVAMIERGRHLRRATQDWYFDALTSLPVQVQYGAPGESSSDTQAQVTMAFSGYTTSQGLVMPQAFSIDVSSVALSACTVTSTAINTSPPSSNFDLAVTGGAQ